MLLLLLTNAGSSTLFPRRVVNSCWFQQLGDNWLHLATKYLVLGLLGPLGGRVAVQLVHQLLFDRVLN